MYVIEINNLSVYYDSVCALDNINMKIKKNEFLGIVGPNGGGKTTLLKVLLRLVRPSSGTISVNQNISIGYVPQFAAFDRTFPVDVLDVVLMGKIPKNIKWFQKYSDEDVKLAINIMTKLGIIDLKNRQIKQLSGGQLQKVLIARALMTDPNILILDEPTASLDVKIKQEIYDILNDIKKEKTILMVTHEMDDVVSYVDRVVYINKNVTEYKINKNRENEFKQKIIGLSKMNVVR